MYDAGRLDPGGAPFGRRRDEVALVLSGDAARGAYEAGAVSCRCLRSNVAEGGPAMLGGTSVGAINAAWLAGVAHPPAEEATAVLLAHCRKIDKGGPVPGRPDRLHGDHHRAPGAEVEPGAAAWSCSRRSGSHTSVRCSTCFRASWSTRSCATSGCLAVGAAGVDRAAREAPLRRPQSVLATVKQ